MFKDVRRKKYKDVFNHEELNQILEHLHWFHGKLVNKVAALRVPLIPAPFLPSEEHQKQTKSVNKIIKSWKKSRQRKTDKLNKYNKWIKKFLSGGNT